MKTLSTSFRSFKRFLIPLKFVSLLKRLIHAAQLGCRVELLAPSMTVQSSFSQSPQQINHNRPARHAQLTNFL